MGFAQMKTTGNDAQPRSRKHRVVVIDAMEAAVRLAVAAIGVSTPQKRRQMGSHQTIPQ